VSRFGSTAGVLAAALALSLGLAAGASAADGPATRTVLSDERYTTYWANARSHAIVRVRPDVRAPRVARLRSFTEDGLPEVYIVLERLVTARNARWLKIRVPMRPNGRTGWVSAGALDMAVVHTRLVLNRRHLRMVLYDRGRRIWTSPVGIGAPGTPTPAGRFWVREKFRAPGGIYGPWAMGTSAYSSLSDWPGGGVIGIHGTNQPSLIPGRPSHGCIRVPNPAIRRLAGLMPVGTPILIL